MEVLSREELLKKYDEVGSFYRDLAPARKGNGWLHIHSNGEPAYEERYDDVDSFSQEGLALVRKGEEWFKIRPDGSRVIMSINP